VIKTAAGGSNGGIRSAMPGEPSYWLAYFGSDDVAGNLAKAVELGGKELVGLTEMDAGRFAVAQDPQGAAFALFGGRFDD
jgi:predicted enzyme related to lactoylglutathione lyase